MSSLDSKEFKLHFILLNSGSSVFETYLKQHQIKVDRVTYKNRKDIPIAFFKILRILIKIKPDIVHCHLIDASLIGLLASKVIGVPKRIFTRHHSTLHHLYHPHAVKIDRFINYLATDIVAISKNVKEVLIKEDVAEKKIQLIYHGFDINRFSNVPLTEIEELQRKYGTEKKFPVIGVISRYVDWKGIQYIIPAFKKLLISFPDAYLILANATETSSHIKALLRELPKENFKEITFENNIFALYHLFDIFVHVPIDCHSEAFGQTYVEALASGIPSIFTLSGIANEFIMNEKNALVVDYKNSGEIYEAMQRILVEPDLAKILIANGKKDIQQFQLKYMIHGLEQLYDQ